MLKVKTLLFMILLLLPMVSLAQKVNILVVSIHGIDTAKGEWQPTVDYLGQTMPHYEFNLVPVAPINLPYIKELIEQHEIDFVITQPAIYVDLELKYGISRILTMVKAGGLSQFGSTIITRADSGIRSIDDLYGTTIAGVAKLGFGGWLVGYDEMLKSGFDPLENAEKIVFLGTHLKEIQAVLEREVDAAVVRTGMLEKFAKDNLINIDDFHVIAAKRHPDFPFRVSTSLYPEWAFAKTRKVSDDVSKAVALALLSLGKDSPIAQRAGFEEWTFPYDYRPVHELLKSLKAGPYKDYGRISVAGFLNQYKVGAIIILILGLIILVMTMVVYRSNIKLSKEKLEKEKALESMKYLATHDSLTGLSNRLLFMELLEKLVHDASRRGTDIAVIFIDLDEFKNINDHFGHSIGDEILHQVGQLLLVSSRINDIAGRLGGDEFVIALNDIKEVGNLKNLTDRFLEGISNIDLPSATPAHVGASIGVIYGSPVLHSADGLIKLSDQLMYKAKQAGKGHAVFQPIRSS